MSYRILAIVLSATMLGVGGCSHGPLQEGFGESTEHNAMIQTVNPGAGKDDVPVATLDGQKAEKQLKTYRTDAGKAVTSTLIDVAK